jgi:hypothetical protein
MHCIVVCVCVCVMFSIGFIFQCVSWTPNIHYNIDSLHYVKLVTQKDYVSNIPPLIRRGVYESKMRDDMLKWAGEIWKCAVADG